MRPVEVIAVIPARYGSTRLPGKPLLTIGNVPMVVRVWQRTSRAKLISRVLVATDDERIAQVVRNAGGEAWITSPDHPSGTDRVAEVAGRLKADIYLNVQGDLPFIEPADLDSLARTMIEDETLAMATLATPITDFEQWRNPNTVKVVCDRRGRALYFSRSPIPLPRDGGLPKCALKHIGVYGYRRDFLLQFAALKPSELEETERLEQLRALENGYSIGVIKSFNPSIEVDSESDLKRAEDWLCGKAI